MDISLEILETSSSFHKKVIIAICDELNKKLPKLTKKIRDNIADKIKPVFEKTKEYELLTVPELPFDCAQ